jgi:hypothetical protein
MLRLGYINSTGIIHDDRNIFILQATGPTIIKQFTSVIFEMFVPDKPSHSSIMLVGKARSLL